MVLTVKAEGRQLPEGILLGIEPTHRSAFIAAVALPAIVTAPASWLPARSAARVDPIVVLRHE